MRSSGAIFWGEPLSLVGLNLEESFTANGKPHASRESGRGMHFRRRFDSPQVVPILERRQIAHLVLHSPAIRMQAPSAPESFIVSYLLGPHRTPLSPPRVLHRAEDREEGALLNAIAKKHARMIVECLC